jgi:[protein-PII] uridylyltransferase
VVVGETVGMTGRREVLENPSLRGVRLARELSRATDEWLAGLWATATEQMTKRAALVAVGGYGRGELAPFSDLDLILLHDGAKNIDEVASKIWYPIWDFGVKLGHSVTTVKQLLELSKTELDSATANLSARHIAGDPTLTEELRNAATKGYVIARKSSERWPSCSSRI